MINKTLKYNYWVYINASGKNGTLYIGVTNNLKNRAWQHKQGALDGFSKKYKVDKLVHYEYYSDINAALIREKQLRFWKRKWKIELIEKANPGWKDLYNELF
ncbi:MAG TPA: GIY-YIG nuclease family protein [bacterium]|nr:GIY-YIG nuclease family protein [bacterium]